MTTATISIPFARPWITDLEKDAVLEVLSGDVLTHGPQSKAFEEEFAAFMGGGYCVSLSSGMAALHLAYFDMGIGAGDEVIVPAQTHVATAHAVEVTGARPVFVDCERPTGNIDVQQIADRITKHTKAISLVHYLGVPCEMNAIMQLADQHGLKVVEDCALAVGARFDGVHVGLHGDAGCFSFYPVKHITTGDGGMFVTKHKAVAERVGKARAFGVDRSFAERTIPGMYDVPTLGLNYRLSDINAAIGRKQLSRIGDILGRRKANFTRLKSNLVGLPSVTALDSRSPRAISTHYCLSVVLDGVLGSRRNDVVDGMRSRGVGTSVYYPQPVPRLSFYRNKYGYDAGSYPEAARISDQSIALPVGPHLTPEDMDVVAASLRDATEELSK
jgi:dTDP-4-amino-4,6-dideoxygalactose transaminase